ncbi:hypothetical protein BGP_0231 [Beggiatoa sp. PS]|nr:hypothetical protein BGP_0231 [Beggiatoa sp. PS]
MESKMDLGVLCGTLEKIQNLFEKRGKILVCYFKHDGHSLGAHLNSK